MDAQCVLKETGPEFRLAILRETQGPSSEQGHTWIGLGFDGKTIDKAVRGVGQP